MIQRVSHFTGKDLCQLFVGLCLTALGKFRSRRHIALPHFLGKAFDAGQQLFNDLLPGHNGSLSPGAHHQPLLLQRGKSLPDRNAAYAVMLLQLRLCGKRLPVFVFLSCDLFLQILIDLHV